MDKIYKIFASIGGFISMLIIVFIEGGRRAKQKIINNNYKEAIEGAKRKKLRNLDSDDTVRKRLLRNARDRKV